MPFGKGGGFGYPKNDFDHCFLLLSFCLGLYQFISGASAVVFLSVRLVPASVPVSVSTSVSLSFFRFLFDSYYALREGWEGLVVYFLILLFFCLTHLTIGLWCFCCCSLSSVFV